MSRDIDGRLKELGIYSDYYYRLELKPLAMALMPDERLTCVLTGITEGRRKLLAVTDSRIIIIGAGVAVQTDITYIKRSAVKKWEFKKKFLFSSVSIETDKEKFLLKNTQAKQRELFEYAMKSEVKEYDK